MAGFETFCLNLGNVISFQKKCIYDILFVSEDAQNMMLSCCWLMAHATLTLICYLIYYIYSISFTYGYVYYHIKTKK